MNKRTTPPQYSYRQGKRKEELKAYRKIAVVILAFFAVLLVIWFMGTSFINALAYLAKGNSANDTVQQDNLPLLFPKLDKLPDAINQDTITVSGSTTANVSVTLTANTKIISTQNSDDQGNFIFKEVALTDGLNLLKVTVKNSQGEKQEASTTITLDKTKPTLVITSPIDGTTYPNSQKNTTVTGTTEVENIVHVSGSQAVVDPNGKFSYNMPIQAGANQIEVTAIDPAGNTETVKLTVSVDAGG